MEHQYKENDFEYAFHQLYLQYSGKVYRFVMSCSDGNKYLAEEVLQTVFMKIWERRQQFDDYSLLRPYLFSMVRNTFYKMCEHEAVKYAYEHYLRQADTPPVDTAADSASLLDEERLRALVMKLAERMPEKRRAVFYKNRFEHKSYNTIAEEMNISEKTVGTHMTMALRYLREHLHEYTSTLLALAILNPLAALL